MNRFKWLAWGGFVLTAIVIAGSLFPVFVPLPGQPLAQDAILSDVTGVLMTLLLALVGAVIAANRRQNPIGWLLIGIGFAAAATFAFLPNYVQAAFWTGTETLPGSLVAAWLNQWIWLNVFLGLVLLFHLFPTGTFLSRRWRWVAAGSVLVFLVLMTLIAFSSPMQVTTSHGTLNLPNPIGLFDTGNQNQITTPGVFFALAFTVSLLAALGSMLLRFARARGVERQQMKWVWFAASILVITIILDFLITNTVFQIFTNFLALSFPIAIGIAILRYRLYDIDLLINRTLVYVPLTAILAGIFSASITLSQRFFVALTGQSSDAATVLTTLIVVATFEPLKTGLQHLVDRRFKEALDPAKKLKAYGEQVNAVVQVLRTEQSARRLLDEAMSAFDAPSGAVFLKHNGELRLVQSRGDAAGEHKLSVPLQSDGAEIGVLSIGARRNGLDYTADERASVQQIANIVASGIALMEKLDGERS